MQPVAKQNPYEDEFPELDVVGRVAEENGFDPGEEEEVAGQLVVDGLCERGVGGDGDLGREGSEVERWVEEVYVGAQEGPERFEVEECEAVEQGDVWGRHCYCWVEVNFL